MAEKRPTYDEYLQEVVSSLGFGESTTNAERNYEFNIRAAHQAVVNGKILTKILSEINRIGVHYRGGASNLFSYMVGSVEEIQISKKSFGSVVQKIYRRNVLYNNKYPGPPRDGLLDPRNLYSDIDDLLRTRIVCKYMDGPPFVCQALQSYCSAAGIENIFRELSTDAGYYAWHFYFRTTAEIMLANNVEERPIWVELQFWTQLSDVISSLTHGFYETRRAGGGKNAHQAWKWDASSPQFRSAFLGHGLHLLEGVIQNFRDEVLDKPVSAEASPEAAQKLPTEPSHEH